MYKLYSFLFFYVDLPAFTVACFRVSNNLSASYFMVNLLFYFQYCLIIIFVLYTAINNTLITFVV